jgi:tetratricopeptide (TPR) repeat protein
MGDSPVKISLKLLMLLLLLIPGPAFGQQEQSPEFASLLSQAQQAQARNDYAAAADAYKKAVKIRTDIPELWANLGIMQHETGHYEEAIRSFRRANQLKASLYVPNLFLGMDYLRTAKPSEAIPFLLQAERLNNTDPEAPLTLGRAYSSLGHFFLAVDEYRRVIRLDPANGSAWFDLGIAYLDQVEEDARRMSSSNEKSAYSDALLAGSLAQQSRYKQAIDLYKQIVASKAQPPCMRSALGFVYLKQHDVSDAEEEFTAEHQTNPGCAEAILGQAWRLIDGGSNQDGLKLLEELWNHDHGFIRSNSPLLTEGMPSAQTSAFAGFLSQQHQSGGIQTDLYEVLNAAFTGMPEPSGQDNASRNSGDDGPSRAIRSSPLAQRTAREAFESRRFAECASLLKRDLSARDTTGLLLLAGCSFLTGDYELTAQAGTTLLTNSPYSPAALYWSIKANERLAFQSLAQFQQLEPHSARSHILLGDIYRQQTRYNDAQVEYKRALDISPNDPAALLGLAFAYFGDANIGLTIETAKVTLRTSPDDPEVNLLMGEAMISRHQFAEAEPFLIKGLGSKPQVLPHVHALLGQVYAETGRTEDAINQLKLGVASDQDGSIHYQLSRLYRKVGDGKDAAAELEKMKVLQRQSRERAVVALEDSFRPSAADDRQ